MTPLVVVLDHVMVIPDQVEMEAAIDPATLKVRELQAGGKIRVTTFLCP